MSYKVFSTTLLGLCGLIAIQSFVSTEAATSVQDALGKEGDAISLRISQGPLNSRETPDQSSEVTAVQPVPGVTTERGAAFEDVSAFSIRPAKALAKAKNKPVTLLPTVHSTPVVVVPENPAQVIPSSPTNEAIVGQHAQIQLSLLEAESSSRPIPAVLVKPQPKKREIRPVSPPQQVVVSADVSLQAPPASVTQDIDSQGVDYQELTSPAENVAKKDSLVGQGNTANTSSQPSSVMPAEPVPEVPLEIPQASIGTVLLNQLAREQTHAIPEGQLQSQHYAIQRGDTLYKLSRRFGVALDALVETNQIENPDVIFAGNSLIVFSPESDLADTAGALLQRHTSDASAYIWPAGGTLTSGYGWRWGRMHRGVDIAAPVGTPVGAAAAGVVEFAGWNTGGYGNLVEIRHGDGSLTRYAHNSRLWVQRNQPVLQGQLIAEMGSTGRSTGPHLHFEIHQPEQGSVNPLNHLVAEMPGQG